MFTSEWIVFYGKSLSDEFSGERKLIGTVDPTNKQILIFGWSKSALSSCCEPGNGVAYIGTAFRGDDFSTDSLEQNQIRACLSSEITFYGRNGTTVFTLQSKALANFPQHLSATHVGIHLSGSIQTTCPATKNLENQTKDILFALQKTDKIWRINSTDQSKLKDLPLSKSANNSKQLLQMSLLKGQPSTVQAPSIKVLQQYGLFTRPTFIPTFMKILVHESIHISKTFLFIWEIESKVIHFNVVLYLPQSTPMSYVINSLQKALQEQLRCAQCVISQYPDFYETRSFYFEVPGMELLVPVVYPARAGVIDDGALLALRQQYHDLYSLPSQPLLRSANRINFSPSKSNNTRLQDVHVGLSTPPSGSIEALVRGNYCYYHYTQDDMNDSGWGCAYRSLQTIESWFIHQKLTNAPVQTHRDIQKLLFSLGQRTRQFIGSTEWIGSLEIQSVLRAHMQIESKILHIARGSEILQHTQTLIQHFQKEGTPIMIGGGQLAFTMLGVQHNPNTSKTMYLILDPHYTGKDELHVIQSKGWCGWKEPEAIFKDKYFFNLCMPLVPSSALGI